MPRVRNFDEVIQRVEGMTRCGWNVQSLAEVWGYPYLSLERTAHPEYPVVMLTAGIHGEEPGSVEGALRWLEGGSWKSYRLNWLVLPCINPYGWERNQRRNRQRLDINRQFRGATRSPEAKTIQRLVRGRRFVLLFDMHEDIDAPGYYVYELRREPPFAGERILDAVRPHVKIHPPGKIDGNRATLPGLVRRDASRTGLEKRPRWPMAYYVFRHCTDHVLGSETPVREPLEKRARAQQIALEAALQWLVRAKKV